MNAVAPYIVYLMSALTAVIILLFLAAHSWQQHLAPGARAFSWVMLTLAGFATFNGLIILTDTPDSTLLVGRVGFIFVAPLPVIWLIFVLQYTGHQAWLTKRRLLWVSLVPAITLLAIWIDPLLPLIWADYQMVLVGPFMLFDVRFGPLMVLFILYTYGLMLWTAVSMLRGVFYLTPLYRRQVLAILIAILIPMAVNILYVTRFMHLLPHVDFTPLGFALSGLVMTWNLFRYRLFSLGPIAREVLIERMQEGVLVLDPRDYIVDANPAARTVLGMPLSGLAAITIDQLLPMWPQIRSQVDTTSPVTEEIMLPGRVSAREFELSITPLYDGAGNFSGRLLILHEITAHRQIESELRQRALELESLAFISGLVRTAATLETFLPDALAQATQVLGAAFTSVYLLKSGTDILELCGNYPLDFPMVGLQHRLGEGITGHVAATGEVYITEDVTRDPRAHLLPQEVALTMATALRSQVSLPLRVQDVVLGVLHVGLAEKRPFRSAEIRLATAVADILAGAINRFMIVAGLEREVAARTADIRAEQEKLAIILNSVQDAIVLFDLDLMVDYVNPAFVVVTEYSAEEVCGIASLTDWLTYLPEHSRQMLQAAINEQRSWQGELTLPGRNGRFYEAALIISPVHNMQGELIGYISSHHDITWRLELEQARSQFLSNVSHQLRTPVTNIKLYADLFKVGQSEEKRNHYMHILMEQVDRLEHLVQDIIEMTVLDSGEGLQSWEIISWPDLLEAIGGRFATDAQESQLTLTISPLPSDLPVVYGDSIRLVQAVAELVSNAFVFTPPAGVVTVTLDVPSVEKRPWLTIAVRDTGPGIAPAEQERVFERFYRGQLAASGHIPGTGLGLSIVQAIISAHGGRVTVESVVGQGSLFVCWLPITVGETATA
ncbi:MAG: histidine kinase N-terminal 7TM domain-containing protein [Chloroflexota bacterium]